MKLRESDVSADDILARYNYDPDTGVFTHKFNKKNRKAGAVAGYKTKVGYIKLEIKRRQFFAHRVAWLVTYGEWPSGSLDHINQNKADNSIDNLRVVNATQNGINIKARSKTSGSLGVHFGLVQGLPRYTAHIRVRRKLVNLGRCKTLAEARTLRWIAEIMVFSIDQPDHHYIRNMAKAYLKCIGPLPEFVAEDATPRL
jgi:hypothetical protein